MGPSARSGRVWGQSLILIAAAASNPSPRAHDPAPALARDVTIYRDRYGIPHVVGRTDAATAFGFGFAQAEDNFSRIEENYLRALGRISEVIGEPGLADDRINRALEIERLARAEYRRLDPAMRALVDGYVAGINYYIALHPGLNEHLAKVDGWYPLAFIRYNYYQQGFLYASGIRPQTLGLSPRDPTVGTSVGSNGWAISPKRTKNGRALLFINPHLPWFGFGQVYEGHLMSSQGWNFTGYTRFGFPFPYVGHNEAVGWVSTDNAADQADAYAERFDDPKRPLQYTYGTGTRTAREWTDSIGVRVGDRIEWRKVTLKRTHHGPLLEQRDGKWLAVKMARLEDDGWLREWYDMTRAQSVSELKTAMRPLKMLFGNVMAADRQGHTWYLYNGAIPKRDPAFDWSQPVDGADPRTEWQGFHAVDELPSALDPEAGWMQNCNTSPFVMTDAGNPDSTRFPRYMVQEGDNPRGEISRQLMRATTDWTLESLARAAFDTRVVTADSLPHWIRAVRSDLAANDRDRLEPALSALEQWDRRSTAEALGPSLLFAWRAMIFQGEPNPAQALAKGIKFLEDRFGTWRVPFGEMSRIQRVSDRYGPPRFRDDGPSLPLIATPGFLGTVFTAWQQPVDGAKRLYGQGGGSYVSVVEFGPTTRALAVHAFGASGDSTSTHFADQMRLYAAGQFRPVWFTREEIRVNAEVAYHPGERARTQGR